MQHLPYNAISSISMSAKRSQGDLEDWKSTWEQQKRQRGGGNRERGNLRSIEGVLIDVRRMLGLSIRILGRGKGRVVGGNWEMGGYWRRAEGRK